MKAVLFVGLLGGCLLAAAAPAGAGTLYALVDTGELFVSADQGVTWAAGAALPTRDAVALVAGSTSAELYLATRTGTVFRSANAGTDWTTQGGIPAVDVTAMVMRIDGSILLLTASGVLWESSDDGVTFLALAAVGDRDQVSLACTGDRLFALTARGVISASGDNGQSWEPTGCVTASDAVEIVAGGDGVRLLTSTGQIWSSADGAETWDLIGTLSQVHMAGMLAEPGGLLYAVTREGEVARSADGIDWSWVGAVNQLSVVALACDAPSSGIDDPLPPSDLLLVAKPLWSTPLRAGVERLAFEVSSGRPGMIACDLADIQGRRILSGPPQDLGGGTHEVLAWPVEIPAAGVYYVRLATSDGRRVCHRLVCLD